MTKESVIDQLVYYLHYGSISKELQEDIKEVLLKKKDIFVLERLLDSVEYELNKNSENNLIYKNDNINKNNNGIINKGLNFMPKINNNANLKNNFNKLNSINIKQNEKIYIENNKGL